MELDASLYAPGATACPVAGPGANPGALVYTRRFVAESGPRSRVVCALLAGARPAAERPVSVPSSGAGLGRPAARCARPHWGTKTPLCACPCAA